MFSARHQQQSKSAQLDIDRRVYPRYPSSLETSCQPIGSGTCWKAQVRDVSLGGIGLVLSRHFKPGTLLQMVLESDDQSRSVLARVVHARQQEDGSWLIGCSFSSELDNEDLQAFSAARVAPSPSESRTWVRFSCDVESQCQAVGSEEVWPVRIVNIAPGGVGLQAVQSFADGAFIDLELPGRRSSRIVRVRIVYRERITGGWFFGCEFSKQLTDDELATMVG